MSIWQWLFYRNIMSFWERLSDQLWLLIGQLLSYQQRLPYEEHLPGFAMRQLR
jgi:hypothetical protein